MAIVTRLQELHLPNGIVIDPMFESPDGQTILTYTRGADAAIWTGHYLASEAFRYAAGRPEALENIGRALSGIRMLLDVTGNDQLARCAFPEEWPHGAGIINEEQHHGIYTATRNGAPYIWIGNTSRDQYSGVLFGLSVTYELVNDPLVQTAVRDLVTRALDYLIASNWQIVSPNGQTVVFLGRSDQILAFLAVGRQVNPTRFAATYAAARDRYAGTVWLPILYDSLNEHSSYFKFNLNYINLYSLTRLESDEDYRAIFMRAYQRLRGTTAPHGNAHFNMIDRALRGPDPARDAETVALLTAWLERPVRNPYWNWSKEYAPLCGENRACVPLPVERRIPTDFLWQRSPFQVTGGGADIIERAGIDYLLPYWMARYYGILN